MYKFTTIILLLVTFSVGKMQVLAQSADLILLKKVNGVESTVGFSHVVSNTTTIVSAAVPLLMSTVALASKDDDLLKDALFVGVSIGIDGVMTYSLKRAINRPRPEQSFPSEIIARSDEMRYSFPSGHTSLAFATATALSLKYPKWYVIAPACLWAGSVGYSRMNLGVHYPSDVLAGAVLGAGSAWVSYKINKWFWTKTKNKRLIGLSAYR